MKQDLATIKNKSLPILQKYSVSRAGVFGSYAKNENNLESDIDILVEVPRGTGLFKFASMKLELEKVLESDVDLVSYSGLKEEIKQDILASEHRII